MWLWPLWWARVSAGSVAEYLAVHKIAYAYQAAHKSYSHSETVESPQRIAARHKTAVKQHGYYYADSPSMARKTALPCGENLKGMLRIIIPLIKEHMAETRAHHSGHSHIYRASVATTALCSFCPWWCSP